MFHTLCTGLFIILATVSGALLFWWLLGTFTLVPLQQAPLVIWMSHPIQFMEHRSMLWSGRAVHALTYGAALHAPALQLIGGCALGGAMNVNNINNYESRSHEVTTDTRVDNISNTRAPKGKKMGDRIAACRLRVSVTANPAVRGTTFHPLLATKAQACVGHDNLPHMSYISGSLHPVYDFLLDTPPDLGCRVQKPWASPRLSYTLAVLGVQSSSCRISSFD